MGLRDSEGLNARLRRTGSAEHVLIVDDEDVVMPRLNGVDLLRQLVEISPDVPVLLVSGYAPVQLEERGIVVPCAMLAKPYLPEQLLGAPRRCIDDRLSTSTRSSNA